MSKKQQKTFTANFRIVAIVSVEVKADTLEKAIQKANDVKESDVFKVLGVYNDGSGLQLIGVSQDDLWNTD